MRLPTQLLYRKNKSHKGDFGHVFILSGSQPFSGAAVLCSWAAIRCGAGLVTLGVPKGLNNAIIKIKPPEVMTLGLAQTENGTLSLKAFPQIRNFAENIDILAIGPGLSQDDQTQQLTRKVIASIDKPAVIDADALNALANNLHILRKRHRASTILTPHPGEMSRLLGGKIGPAAAERKNIAKTFANEYNCIVVLKGHGTVVAGPEGTIYTNNTGNPGMATAGTGDVLTGMIAAFLGQKCDAFTAAKYAVYLHGLAGDLAAKEKTQIGLIASDIIEKIPEAIKKCSE